MNEITLIQNRIYEIRGQRVMLDFDLATLYRVETKALNRAVKRNIERFPERYMLQSYRISEIGVAPSCKRESPPRDSERRFVTIRKSNYSASGVTLT